MENIKKFKKLFIVIIFTFAILLGTKVQAETFSPTYTKVVDGNFHPYKANATHTFYCIHHGSPYRVSLPAGYYEGQYSGAEYCEVCDDKASQKPWDGTKYTMTYEGKEMVNERDYQDAAYVIANAVISGKQEDMETQWSLWMTGLNLGTKGGRYVGGNWVDDPHGTWGDEAIAYKNFYNSIHLNNIDIYTSKVYDKTNINNVTVEVDQNSKTYIVGPFTVEYPNGEYVKEKWSYITNITLLNQYNNAIGDVVNNTIHIVDSSGNELRDSIHGNNFPDTNKEFYVRFNTSNPVDNIKLKVDFEYLESCSATLQKYTGTLSNWVWELVQTDNVCPVCHTTLKRWQLKVEKGGNPQELVALKYNSEEKENKYIATKNYKQTSLIMAPIPVDLTMKISGQVFLDRDSGKVNAGNNIMDGNNEALQGVEVVLYDAETNQVVTKTNTISSYHVHTSSCYTLQEHIHTGNAYTGGGCYTVKVHDHIGNWADGGPCYGNKATHKHTGSPTEIITTIHHHTDSCYSGGGVCGGRISTRTEHNPCFGTSADGYNCVRGGRDCYLKGYPGHDDTVKTCSKCNNPVGNNGESCRNTTPSTVICGYEEGQTIYSGTGCYTKPVYHKHTDDCNSEGSICRRYNRKERIRRRTWWVLLCNLWRRT